MPYSCHQSPRQMGCTESELYKTQVNEICNSELLSSNRFRKCVRPLRATSPKMSGFMKHSSWSCQNIVHPFHAYAAHHDNLGAVGQQTTEGSWAESWGNTEGRTCWLRSMGSSCKKTKDRSVYEYDVTGRSCRSFLFTEAPRAQHSNSQCWLRLRVLVEWRLECSEQSFWAVIIHGYFGECSRSSGSNDSSQLKKEVLFPVVLEDGSVLTG